MGSCGCASFFFSVNAAGVAVRPLLLATLLGGALYVQLLPSDGGPVSLVPQRAPAVSVARFSPPGWMLRRRALFVNQRHRGG